MEHSKTPWRIEPATKKDNWRIVASNGQVVSTFSGSMDMDNARRIVACVNSCADLDTEKLEKRNAEGRPLWLVVVEHKEKIDQLQSQLATERASLFAESQRKQQLEQQVAELMGVLEGLLELHDNPAPFSGKTGEDRLRMIENATAKRNAAIFAARAVIQKVRGWE